jgi:hypothetical protein
MAPRISDWNRLDASAIPLLYTPIERAALSAYLRFIDPAPQELEHVEPTDPVDRDEWDHDANGIAPLRSETDNDDLMLENVVARICLETIQHRLPQWASVSHARVTLGRRVSRKRDLVRDLRPRYLFTINWADSGPGFSWPEAYHVIRLPGYNISVVTASNDSPDASGYCDFAIGSFSSSASHAMGIERCIKDRWLSTLDYGQARWAYLFGTGIVNEDTACAWRDDIWSADDDEEDDDVDQ